MNFNQGSQRGKPTVRLGRGQEEAFCEWIFQPSPAGRSSSSAARILLQESFDSAPTPSPWAVHTFHTQLEDEGDTHCSVPPHTQAIDSAVRQQVRLVLHLSRLQGPAPAGCDELGPPTLGLPWTSAARWRLLDFTWKRWPWTCRGVMDAEHL